MSIENSLTNYLYNRNIADSNEERKNMGRIFCNNHGWKLNKHYIVKQRPDIVNNINGTVYRTYTPIYHVWYQSIKNPRSNMWIDFQKDCSQNITYILRENISLDRISKTSVVPNPSKYCNIRYFKDPNILIDHLIKIS